MLHTVITSRSISVDGMNGLSCCCTRYDCDSIRRTWLFARKLGQNRYIGT